MNANPMTHDTFQNQLGAYLADGLDEGERRAMEAHAASCPTCAAMLQQMRDLDEEVVALFAADRPGGGFEDRIIAELRHRSHWRIHPTLWRAAAGIAAALVLAGVGSQANRMLAWNPSAPAPRPQVVHAWFDEQEQTQLFDGTVMLGRSQADGGSGMGTGSAAGGEATVERFGTYLGQQATDARRYKNSGAEMGLGLGKQLQKDGRNLDFGYSAHAGVRGDVAGKELVRGRTLSETDGKARGGVPDGGTPAIQVTNGAVVVAGDDFVTFSDGVVHSAGGRVAQGVDGKLAEKAKDNAPVQLRFFRPDDAMAASTEWTRLGAGKLLLGGQEKQVEQLDLRVEGEKRDSSGLARVALTTEFAESNADAPAKPGEDTAPADPTSGVPAATGAATTPPPPAPPAPPASPPAEVLQARKIIRNGEVMFEVDSFDSSVMTIGRIVQEEGGFVSSTNSEKLPNGKVRGAVVLRVPPDRLDTLVLKLRALGDLKSQRVSAQDVTKVYYDLESELKAARAMEERLLNIIKSGKGEIKDLLEAEKQLGVYRERIEKLEGEVRYYNNLVSLSTLTVNLAERQVSSAAFAAQTETVNMGIEVEDVDKARTDALKAVEDAKGRIIESNLKKDDAGQYMATLVAEAKPDAAGPLLDRLRQIGRVSRLNIDRKQTAPDGAPIPANVRVEQKDTRFSVTLYNLANVAPRRTSNLDVAVADVEEAYRSILDLVDQKSGRVLTSTLNRQKPEQTTGEIRFEVPSGDAETVLNELRRQRDVMSLTVTESPDANNVTSAKRGFVVQLRSLATVPARQSEQVILATRGSVQEAFNKLLDEARKAGVRIAQSQIADGDSPQVTGVLEIEVMRDKELEVRSALEAGAQVISRNVARSPDVENTVDSKVRLSIRVISMDRLTARETQTMTVASKSVPTAYQAALDAVRSMGGRVIASQLDQQDQGNIAGVLEFEVPTEQRDAAGKALAAAGTIYSRQVTRAADGPNVVDLKVRMKVDFRDAEQLEPRQSTALVVEVAQVEPLADQVAAAARSAGGRVLSAEQSAQSNGQTTGKLVVDVPMAKADAMQRQIESLGKVRARRATQNADVPEGDLARARFDVTLAGTEGIVGGDEGLAPSIRNALSTSVRGLLWSLQLIVIGLLIVVPWALLAYGAWKLIRRRRTAPATPAV